MWPFHKHEWVVLRCKRVRFVFGRGDGTSVIFKCVKPGCPGVKEKVLEGIWYPDDFEPLYNEDGSPRP